METYSSKKLIQSLVNVTDHTDRELLELSLAKSLYDILNVTRISFYKILHNPDKLQCNQSIKIEQNKYNATEIDTQEIEVDINSIQGLLPCIESKQIFKIPDEHQSLSIFYPVTDLHNNVISIFRLDGPKNYNEINEELMSGYFQIYKNYLALLEESERDTLTKLLNRRTFERDLHKLLLEKNSDQEQSKTFEQSRRRNCNETSHWLAVSDIDFFKRVNDNFGHLYGDEVLLLLANIMRKVFRASDILFRFGGEEFVIILRSVAQDGAHLALERFRKAVEDYDFPQVGKISISIGFVEIIDNSIPTEILGRADKALYFSKDNGRNQLHQYEILLKNGKIDSNTPSVDDIELF